MTDAGWGAIASIIASLSAAVIAWDTRRRTIDVAKKTDAQSDVLDRTAKDTKDVKVQTNGHLTEMQRRFDDLIDKYSTLLTQAVDALSKSSPAPVVLIDRRQLEEPKKEEKDIQP